MKLLTKLSVGIIILGLITGTYLFIKSNSVKQTQAVLVINKPKTITFKSKDNLTVTGELYQTNNAKLPYIILYHQAYSSRGEYVEIAPKLNKLGFNCLAIDQRCGGEANGVVNQTSIAATKLGMPTEFTDAYKDLEASLFYVKDELKADKIILWGSSYSASLVVILGSEYPNYISGILSFSPGEYFTLKNKTVEDYARTLKCPTFFTSEKITVSQWQPIFNSIPSKKKVSYIPKSNGTHGSAALFESFEFNKEYWIAVKNFLKDFEVNQH
jgi:dienelactone hydrolase